MTGWIDYLFVRVKGDSSQVGIGWYSQSWRDLRLYISDLISVLLYFFDLGNLMWWVGGLSAQNAVRQCWSSGKTQLMCHIWKCYLLIRVWIRNSILLHLSVCLFLSVLFPYFFADRFTFRLSLCPQLENVIQKSMKSDITNIPPHVVHNQTATMLEIGTNLLTHTAEQTRKLNVVEAKVTSLQFADPVTPNQISWMYCCCL